MPIEKCPTCGQDLPASQMRPVTNAMSIYIDDSNPNDKGVVMNATADFIQLAGDSTKVLRRKNVPKIVEKDGKKFMTVLENDQIVTDAEGKPILTPLKVFKLVPHIDVHAAESQYRGQQVFRGTQQVVKEKAQQT